VILPALPVPVMDAGAIFFRLIFFLLLEMEFLKRKLLLSCCWSWFGPWFRSAFNFSFGPEVWINSFVTSATGASPEGFSSVSIWQTTVSHCYSITFFCFKSNNSACFCWQF
jgi:hypothetical protein